MRRGEVAVVCRPQIGTGSAAATVSLLRVTLLGMRPQPIVDPVEKLVTCWALPQESTRRSTLDRDLRQVDLRRNAELAAEPQWKIVQGVAGRWRPARTSRATVRGLTVAMLSNTVADDRFEATAAVDASKHADVSCPCGYLVRPNPTVVLWTEVQLAVVSEHFTRLGTAVVLGTQPEMVPGRKVRRSLRPDRPQPELARHPRRDKVPVLPLDAMPGTHRVTSGHGCTSRGPPQFRSTPLVKDFGLGKAQLRMPTLTCSPAQDKRTRSTRLPVGPADLRKAGWTDPRAVRLNRVLTRHCCRGLTPCSEPADRPNYLYGVAARFLKSLVVRDRYTGQRDVSGTNESCNEAGTRWGPSPNQVPPETEKRTPHRVEQPQGPQGL
jgi:hypothetical protein